MKYGAIPTNLLERLGLAAGKFPIPLIDAVYGPLKARCLMAGVRLGVFEAMREGEHTAADLGKRLDLDADCLDLLLRVLAFSDYVTLNGDRFALSRLGQQTMIAGGEKEMFGYIEWNYTQWQFIEHLEELVRTGRGLDFHQTLEDPKAWGHYQRGMLEVARMDAPVLAARVPVRRGATRLLDLAGSHGLLGAAICRKHPPMRSTVLDLPRAVEHARALAAAERIDDIVEHRSGDLLRDDYGTGFDIALVSNILHHFIPNRILDILGRTRQALAQGGTVAIWEIQSPKRNSPIGHGEGWALYFRLTSTARTYHGDEYAGWLDRTGFGKIRQIRPTMSPGNVLVIGVAG